MYTLRIVFEDKIELNINLGNSYRVVSSETKQFKEMKDQFYKDNMVPSDYTQTIYKFVIAQDGTEYLLFLSDKHYIVSENGSTFAKL